MTRKPPVRTRELGDPTFRVEEYRAPADCPVCGDDLSVTRLGCESCGTELSGIFAPCGYCGLTEEENELLRVFLTSRGNLREVEKHLGVSYPTARARFSALLDRLGLTPVAEESAADEESAEDAAPAPRDAGGKRDRAAILADVAAGRLTAAQAQALIAGG